jgi:phenylacetate-CoA ligase
MRIPTVGENYQLLVSKSGHLDELTVRIEVTRRIFEGDVSDLVSLKNRIEGDLRSALGIRVNVDLVEPESLPRSEGKAKRVLRTGVN